MPLADLQSTIAPDKLRYIGLVSAHQIDSLLIQHKIPEIKRRAVLNQLYNMRHTSNAEDFTVKEFHRAELIRGDSESSPYVEINIPSKGVTGSIGPIIWQPELSKYLILVGTDSYLLEGEQAIRVWKHPEAYRDTTPSQRSLQAARDSVGRFNQQVEEAKAAAERERPCIQFVQNNFSPEALSASEIYRQTRRILEENSRAGSSHISSEHTIKWVVENLSELYGRTVEIRRSNAIHPMNGSFIKGVLTDAWVTNDFDAMLVINGTNWADNLEGSALVYEPQFCNHMVDPERSRRCSKLNKHDGDHA